MEGENKGEDYALGRRNKDIRWKEGKENRLQRKQRTGRGEL